MKKKELWGICCSTRGVRRNDFADQLAGWLGAYIRLHAAHSAACEQACRKREPQVVRCVLHRGGLSIRLTQTDQRSVLPDRPFPDLGASKYAAQRFLTKSVRRSPDLETVKGPVGGSSYQLTKELDCQYLLHGRKARVRVVIVCVLCVFPCPVHFPDQLLL